MSRNFRNKPVAPETASASPPSEAWLFAQEILGKPIPNPFAAQAEARAKRKQLEWLAQISTDHERELKNLLSAEAEARRQRKQLEWLATISTEHERKLRNILAAEAETRQAQARHERYYESYSARIAEWDEVDHPRQPKGTSDGGQWVAKGGGGSGSVPKSAPGSGFIRTVPYRPDSPVAKLAAAGGAASPPWPASGSSSTWLPKIGSGVGAGVGSAAGVIAGGLLAGLRNASMGAYWSRVSGEQAMPSIWAWELERRVRAGTLSHEDAVAIFNTAMVGAEAQGFKPTGVTSSAVHKSAVDFLGKAEAVYFARKKKAAPEPASLPGAYLRSGGRVFPTERNSGLTGDALLKEQEEFFERGLSQGKDPGYLRGQVSVAGPKRAGGWRRPNDRILDPEVEAALQRAIQKNKK